MLKLYTVQEAQKTILKRQALDESDLPQAVLDGIERIFGERLSAEQAVQRILKDVRSRGDEALRAWTETLDHIRLDSFRVPEAALNAALEGISVQQRDFLALSIERVQAFHRRQPLTSWLTNDLGGSLGQLVRPIRRVGLYIPGGTAPLPSSVIMSAVPAHVAGVKDIVVVTPPGRQAQQSAGNASAPQIILAACALAGVSEVYTLGGAQAIAALAYGTQSIPAVDKIFGPGNLFVTLAKRQVYGTVGIDGLNGPTETMVIADDTARPDWVAADLLAQAEHDVLASAILFTPSRSFAERTAAEVARQASGLPRREIVQSSLENRSGAVITHDLEQALELANAYGAEHLCLAVKNPWQMAEKVNNAGGIFLGEHSFEVLGDYVAGPSHVMPTGGSARFASPLNVWDFVHLVSLVALDAGTGKRISQHAADFARSEGLEAHARSADFRAQD